MVDFSLVMATLLNIGIFIYLVLSIFQLSYTSSGEFDASIRAKKQLVGLGIVEQMKLKA